MRYFNDFGKRLREIREIREISREELGEKLGVTYGTIANWELSRSSPNYREVAMLADSLNISADYLLGRTDEVQTSTAPGTTISDRKSWHINTPTNPALPPILRRMFATRRIREPREAVLATQGALTVQEIEQLLAGASPLAIPEERLVAFFRYFPMELIQEYYRAARVMLPQEFRDLLAELREITHQVRMHNFGSPIALQTVIDVARQAFEEEEEKEKKSRE